MNRKATWEEVTEFVKLQLTKDIERGYFHSSHLKVLINNLYPWSWKKYCNEHKLNPILRVKE